MQYGITSGVSMQRDQIDARRISSAGGCKACEAIAALVLDLCDDDLESLTLIGLLVPEDMSQPKEGSLELGPTVMITSKQIRGQSLPPGERATHDAGCEIGRLLAEGIVFRIGVAYDVHSKKLEVDFMPVVGQVFAPVCGAIVPD
jgi:hypothetical protein